MVRRRGQAIPHGELALVDIDETTDPVWLAKQLKAKFEAIARLYTA
jgi:hypothetical protein